MKRFLFSTVLIMLLAFTSVFTPAIPPGDMVDIAELSGEVIQTEMHTTTGIIADVMIEPAADEAFVFLTEGAFSVYDITDPKQDASYTQPPDSYHQTSTLYNEYIHTKLIGQSDKYVQTSSIYVPYGLRFRYG